MVELSLWLDTYDDIYSDFDSRSYLKRRISEDFIDELRMSLKYRKDQPDALILMLPGSQRHADIEKEITISIHEQIKDRLNMLLHKVRNILTRGLLLFATGLLLTGVSAFVTLKKPVGYLPLLLRISLEPASWFMLWTGLDLLIYDYRKLRKETFFYKILASLKVHFKDI